MSDHRASHRPRLSRKAQLSTALTAIAVGALLVVVALRPGSAPVTASTVPMPIASASPGDVVGCDPIDPTLAPDGQLDLPLRCYLPPAQTVTETTTITTPVPVTTTVTQTVTVTPSPTTPVTTTPPVTTRPPATTPPPSPTPTPTTPPPTSGFPNAANTGVPASVVTTPWTGSCAINTAQTIDSRSFTCDLTINAAVTILNSRIAGAVEIGAKGSLTMVDSEVNTSPGAPRQETGVETHDFTLLRVEIQGGNRGAYCAQRCTIQDSWVHGQRLAENWHASAVRMEQNTTLIHNTLVCDALDGGGEQSCSASLTGYGDYAPVQYNLIQNNYFPAKNVNGGYSLGFCAYGGSSNASGPNKKPFGDQANHIQFLGNVFERGQSGKCGYYAAVADWDGSRPGNVFSGNLWSDGKPFLSP